MSCETNLSAIKVRSHTDKSLFNRSVTISLTGCTNVKYERENMWLNGSTYRDLTYTANILPIILSFYERERALMILDQTLRVDES